MAVKRHAEAIWIESKGYWQVKVQLDGKRKAFTSSIKGRKGKHEAEGKADEWLEKGTTEMRFDAAWAQFLEDQKQRTGTANWKKHEYLGRIYLLPELGNTRLSKITPNMWRACIDAGQRNGLSRRSLQNIKLSISAFVNFARRERWEIELLERGDLPITKDAPEANRKILQPVALKTLFTEDTIIHWGHVERSFFIHAWRFLVLTGLRRGELCGLRNEDIVDGVVTIKRSVNAQQEITAGKNDNARRSFALSDAAKAELDAQREMLIGMSIISPWVFPDEHGEMLNSSHLYSMWDTFRNQHDLGCSLHELRHTFVSVVQNDVPLPLLKSMIGHSEDMDTSGVYGHAVNGDMVRAANIVDDAFSRFLPQVGGKVGGRKK